MYLLLYINKFATVTVQFEITEPTLVTFDLYTDEVLHVTDKRFVSFSIDTSEIQNGLNNPSLR